MKYLLALTFCFYASISAITQEMKPEETKVWDPEPAVITPGMNGSAPSDAIVLFDGKSLDGWVDKDGGPSKWKLEDGAMVAQKGAGDIITKHKFESAQIHIEWRTPAKVEGESQGRGNSGIFLQGVYELQVLDSYNNRTYSNGQAGSIYKQTMPLANASKGPGEWQTYDIIYHAPTFNSGHEYKTHPTITVFHNGVLIQDHTKIQGTTPYIGPPKVNQHGKGPLKLQDHGNPTAFRNIWIREL
ncbi:MAG: DUF1080 domain-containing protein [Saprospiraceae bacterium]|nr:DUF1080 domain-containing protein [Saprospiraceae bacterium]